MSEADDGLNSGRIRRLTQAALNVDVTLGRVEETASQIGVSLGHFKDVLDTFDGTLTTFADTLTALGASIDDVDRMLAQILGTRQGPDGLLERAERVLTTVDWVLTPLTVTRRISLGALGAVTGRAAGRAVTGPLPAD